MSTETVSDRRGLGALHWLWLSGVVVLLDQWTKDLVIQHFALYERLELLPVLGLTRLHNTGAAFSFLSTASGWQRWLFVALAGLVTAMIAIWLKRLPSRGRGWLAASLALVVGGAVGNLIDRLQHGYVVDFISVHWEGWFFPAFNVADSAITVGAIMLLLDGIFDARRHRAPSSR